jgi:hypothetical protein
LTSLKNAFQVVSIQQTFQTPDSDDDWGEKLYETEI